MIATAQKEVISRAWAMPSPDTLSIPPIRRFVAGWMVGSMVSVDPFARDSKVAMYTNDINPKTSAFHHMEATAFLAMLVGQGVKADRIIFDPPYSPTQTKRSYESAGLVMTREAAQTARLKKACRDQFRLLAAPGCIVLSFGWNTVGMGDGWETLEVLIVDHGGDHNATLCLAQKLT